MSSAGLVLDAGILMGLAKERPPNTPLTDWLKAEQSRAVPLVTIRDVTAECITVPVALLVQMHILVEPSLAPPDPQGLLQAFSAGKRDLSWVEDLPRADRAVVAHAIARRFDIVTTDAAMKEKSFKEFLKRLERTQMRSSAGVFPTYWSRSEACGTDHRGAMRGPDEEVKYFQASRAAPVCCGNLPRTARCPAGLKARDGVT